MSKCLNLTVGVTYTFKNIKSSVGELQEICNNYDITLLQEIRLLQCELGISKDFYSKGVSAVDKKDPEYWRAGHMVE